MKKKQLSTSLSVVKNVLSWPSGSRRCLACGGRGVDARRFHFDLLVLSNRQSFIVLCANQAKVRNRLKWGFRLFVEQTADNRASHNFHCSWMGFLEPGPCLSALKSQGFASALFAHLSFGRSVGYFWTLLKRSALRC
uniref:Uncharacterized protein n=1 Tax=Heterorhabditis bacteriophora TaxID=37862 RepID=A0A1I7WNM3_HETBA